MKTIIKKGFCIILIMLLVIKPGIFIQAGANDFADVQSGHWSYEYVNRLRQLGITNGIGDNMFGLGQTITRAEFVTFLCNLMKWESVTPSDGSFADNKDEKAWYYKYIETALYNHAIGSDSASFRPNAPITREEMAVMLVRALGYDGLAGQITYLGSPFADVTANTGYITIAKDLGIISGMGDNSFAPYATATREQAATMMIRMYDGINRKIDFVNAFYAISSAGQMDAIKQMDSISYGWSKLAFNEQNELYLNTTSADNNEYRIPSGFEEPFESAGGKTRMLMVAVKDIDSSKIINDTDLQNNAVQIISNAINNGLTQGGQTIAFDGVVVDFETLKGTTSKNNYNTFLLGIKNELLANNKKIYVAVHPKRRSGQEYFDGYDYRAIGQIADKVILMAHDYNAKSLTSSEMEQGIVMTPLAPIEEIYYALRAITDRQTGVEDVNKIMIQISFATSQWKTIDGKVINQKPYLPDYQALANRIRQGVDMKYSKKDESPYITFYNQDDGTNNIIWYEDSRSVAAKLKLARLFGITDVSLWRLGNIPNDGSDIYLDTLQKIR